VMSIVQNPLAIVLVFSGAGATLKLADHFGENSQSLQAYACAILSGFFLGLLMHIGAEESSYVLGIVLGVVLGLKVNRLNLVAGLFVIGVVALALGFSIPDLRLVTVVAILSLIDEIGHDRFGERKGLIGLLFRYRAGLKSGTIILAVAILISLTTAAGFLCFDLSYDAVSYIVELQSRASTP
jgi:hypothetical protein